MDETTPAVKLRSDVVRRVVGALIILTFLLYSAVIVLLLVALLQGVPLDDLSKVVPGELWLAAGNASGALGTLLVNTRHDPSAQDPAPVQVMNQPGDPVPVDPAPEDPVPPVEDDVQPDDEPEPPPAPKQRRR